MIYLHYRLQGKAKSFLRLLHHTCNAGIRISAKESLLTHTEIKLDGNLTDVFTATDVLFPYVFQIRRCDETEVKVANYLLRITHNTLYPPPHSPQN